MQHTIVLTALIIIPIGLFVALKANAAVGFASLCVGSMLLNYVAQDATDFAVAFSPGSALAIQQAVKWALLTLPMFLALLFTQRNIYGRKRFANFVVAIACGLLYALLMVPLLPTGLQKGIMSQQLWHELSNLQTILLVVGATISLAVLYANHKPYKEDKKSKTK
ncbi:MAG: hypothetical protein WAQ24_03705 [Candidatus Saccharimonadales bacterium]